MFCAFDCPPGVFLDFWSREMLRRWGKFLQTFLAQRCLCYIIDGKPSPSRSARELLEVVLKLCFPFSVLGISPQKRKERGTELGICAHLLFALCFAGASCLEPCLSNVVLEALLRTEMLWKNGVKKALAEIFRELVKKSPEGCCRWCRRRGPREHKVPELLAYKTKNCPNGHLERGCAVVDLGVIGCDLCFTKS